jgi:hypothetical protein
MKVKIGPHADWFGPYQLAELLCFWVKEEQGEYGIKSKPHWVHQFGEWLAHGSIEPEPQVGEITSWNHNRPDTVLSKFLSWIHSRQQRKIKVEIDPWDTWNMDHTLALIVLPMLRQLKEKQHGAGSVDDKDVPKELRSTSAEPKENEWDTDSNHFARWEWVMDEMIFAFNSKVDDSWENQFDSGEHDIQWKKLENGNSEMIKGPKDTFDIDMKGRLAYEKRIQTGFALFGKYYQNLWD